MIVVELQGGHSNQLFQYAVGRALALRNDTSLKLDLGWFNNIPEENTPRLYELNSYNIHAKIYRSGFPGAIKDRFITLTDFKEKSFNYDPAVNKLKDNVHLSGYFQSEKYFKDIRTTLLADLSYKSEATGSNKLLHQKILSDNNAVSLHVRRGDYVQDKKTNQFHGLKDIEYYRAALNELKKTVKKPNLYVISNDPAWCKKNLVLDAPMVVADNNDDITGGAEDMRLMRACRHNIMANSSFSWWGAWLNPNPNKVVIAPKKWFNDPGMNTSDLIPEEWVRL